jgi:ABC-type dipeptide/oligopeptide/nickel transport systems, permease components
VGYLTYQALETLDLPMIMATVIYASVFVVVSNAVVDILYAAFDPRMRLRR